MSIRRWMYVALATAAPLLLIGIWLGAISFLQNFTTELAGILISTAVTILLVERILDREKGRVWGTARVNYARAADLYIEQFLFECLVSFVGIPHNRKDDGTYERLTGADVANYVETHRGELSSLYRYRDDGSVYMEVSPQDASSSTLLHKVSPTLSTLQRTVTPRVLGSEHDPKFANLLLRIERAMFHWRSKVELVEDDWGLAEADAWAQFEILARCVDDLDNHLRSRYGELRPSDDLEAFNLGRVSEAGYP
ncbi:hypothetical protein [Catellatospora chokoriensis]|uniref:Uncharacterized protein n=1 Tax=Catellatospora chokoriensis TaxID=310353 RepID=A0A8J3NUR9_9ACTN|nr:hypothetical protein [Catellatospora chokoriensis]GIF91520.1 hypothetical protein Cch02nite_49640 [Catellatospora chokoriensis]